MVSRFVEPGSLETSGMFHINVEVWLGTDDCMHSDN